jgi:hypothetical protein
VDPRQPAQPRGQPPVPIAEDVHEGGEQREPDQERVQGDGSREPGTTAGASKASLYKRWSNRAELVVGKTAP